jgi:hypothetical protein
MPDCIADARVAAATDAYLPAHNATDHTDNTDALFSHGLHGQHGSIVFFLKKRNP